MITKRLLPIIIFLFSVVTPAHSQTDSNVLVRHIRTLQRYSAVHPIEKVYVHLDRDWYPLGDTAWFKAYTVVGPYHQLSALSGVLYAELISPQDSVVKRLVLQLNAGIASGDFVFPFSCKPGAYRLRAYTNWMRNDSAYLFERTIFIGGLAPVSTGTTKTLKSNAVVPQSTYNTDVQFFPEGGDLVSGLRSRVAFKAINSYGLPVAVQGVITDQDGNEAALFSTQHNGMGEFALMPLPGKVYQARVACPDGSSFTAALPKVKDDGFVLSVNHTADSVDVKVAANERFYQTHIGSTFYLVVHSGGKYYYGTAGKLTSPVFTLHIAASRFPAGIVQFTLFRQSGEPLAERIIFIQNNGLLKLSLAAEQQVYKLREPVSIRLEAQNQGKAVAGNFSVAVTDETRVPVDEIAEHTILTDLLLSAELKGNITDPNYYFNNADNKTRHDLDLLMLTQGYRRFDWIKIMATENTPPKYKAETTLSLAGTVTTPGGKPVAGGQVRLSSVKDLFILDTLTDAEGRFVFNNVDLPDTTKVVIKAKKAKGGDNVKINIQKPNYPNVDQTVISAGEDTVMSPQLAKAMQQAYITGKQASLKQGIQLREVRINAKKNDYWHPKYSDNMQASANLNGPGNADQVVLSDVIMRDGGGLLSQILPSKLFNVNLKRMALFVDGAQISPNEIDDINPADIYSIEVLKHGGYLAIYGSNAPHGALIITMKRGADENLRTVNTAVDGLITYKFNGYYKARSFYSPNYDAAKTTGLADDRKTIYWNPDVITGADGKAAISFFNAGSAGTYRVVVEGIDADGNLGRVVYRYKVE